MDSDYQEEPRPTTVRDPLESPLIDIWADRDDIGASVEHARKLRRHVEANPRGPTEPFHLAFARGNAERVAAGDRTGENGSVMLRYRMDEQELFRRVRSLQGKDLRTAMGREFGVEVRDERLYFTPRSTNVERACGRRATERFLVRYNETGSVRPKDYLDVTVNASYLLALG